MKHLKILGWASLFLMILVSSCRKNIIEPDQTIKVPEPVVLVETSLKGQVIDENNDPVADVKVHVGSDVLTTDENGFFSVANVDLNKNGTHVTAEKFGYFFASKMYNPTVGSESFLLFQLLDKQTTGTFTSSTGGEIATADGASVVFGANSIMYENGTAYEGEVRVSAKHIDPTHPLIAARMPGDLRAIDTEEELVQLATYGMMVVELEAPNGTKLQILDGNTATITMPLPSELLSVAPSTIPLWYFDETTGYWVQESSATLQGDKYVGEVAHFSWWNCDAPFPIVNFETTIVDLNGDPIQWMQVRIGNAGVGVRYAWSNDQGYVGGDIPANEELTLDVIDQCANVLYTVNIGPYSSDATLDDIQVTGVTPADLIGRLLKCDGSPLTDGYAIIDGVYYDEYLEVDENGNFSKTQFACASTDITIIGYDVVETLKSDPVTMTIPTMGGTVDFGDIEVCEAITDLITVTIPDLSYEKDFVIYNAYEDATGGLTIQSELDSVYFQLGLNATTNQVGTADITTFNFSDWEGLQTYIYCQGNCPTFEIVTNDGPGGLFEGSTTALFDSEGGTQSQYEVTIDVKVYLE